MAMRLLGGFSVRRLAHTIVREARGGAGADQVQHLIYSSLSATDMQTEHIVLSAIKASLRTRSFVPHVVRAAASLYLVSFRMILSAAKPTMTHLQCPLLDDSCVMEMTPTQAALIEAATAGRIGKTSQRWCSELRTNGQGEQCTWGFRIYRTVYTPGSDDGKQGRLGALRGSKHRNH
jgi:hypothetical protein